MKMPLENIHILDLSRMISGSYGSMILGDLGANVIKIEPPSGDPMRDGPGHRIQGQRTSFLSFNRNKKSVVLDLKKAEGQEVFFDLLKKSDVVINNFKSGVMEKLNLGFDCLIEHNPLIVFCSITGFGEEGPYKNRRAYDLVIQALSGAMSLTGEKGRPPVRMGISVVDHVAGMFAAIAILAGLNARNLTGKGQRVTTSLLEGMISLLSYEGTNYLFSGEIPGPRGSGHTNMVPYQAFETKNSYLVVAVRGNSPWRNLCKALNIEELIEEPQFATPVERKKNEQMVTDMLQRIFKTKTTEEWNEILDENDVPFGPINTIDKALTDPQVLACEMVVKSVDREGRSIKLMGNPIKIKTLPFQKYAYPPDLGEHTEQVLSELLGYSQNKLSDLRSKKVV